MDAGSGEEYRVVMNSNSESQRSPDAAGKERPAQSSKEVPASRAGTAQGFSATSESPLLKLRRAIARDNLEPSARSAVKVLFYLLDAEERWVAERELHRDQVKRIRRARHEYIMTLREQVRVQDEVIRDLTAALRMEAGE